MKFKRIRDLREDHDRSQKDIATFLKCNEDLYAKYENGNSEIPISRLIKLARYYDVSIDYILGKTKIQKRYP